MYVPISLALFIISSLFIPDNGFKIGKVLASDIALMFDNV